MSIQSEITRINNNVQQTLGVIADTGVAVPSGANSDDLPALAAALANEKAPVNHTHDAISLGGIPIVSATSSDGISYEATVDGVTALYVGLTIRIIPSRVSAQLTPTLNLNGLGAKNIIMPIDGVNAVITTNAAKLPTWLSANHPMEITFDGIRWRSEIKAQSASYMYGRVPVDSGGVPAPDTDTDEGKFMRVVSGVPAWVTVDSAEGASF